jgi:hypothetical protein
MGPVHGTGVPPGRGRHSAGAFTPALDERGHPIVYRPDGERAGVGERLAAAGHHTAENTARYVNTWPETTRVRPRRHRLIAVTQRWPSSKLVDKMNQYLTDMSQ